MRSAARPGKVDVKLFGGDDTLTTVGLRAVDINIETDQGRDTVDLFATPAG